MPTRKELLETIKSFDTAKLEKIVAVADKLLLPDYDMLVQVSFANMVEKAHVLADEYFPEWTDRSKADFGEFLVELFSLFSWKDFYYINMFANEFSLLKAKSYKVVYLLACMLGYKPKLNSSAGVVFNVTFTGVPVGGITVKKGDIEISINGTDLVFTNTEEKTVLEGNSVVAFQFHSGRYRNQTGTYIGRTFRIPGDNASFEQFTSLTIGADTWTKVQDFSGSDSDSQHFLLLPTDSNEFEIIFGNGVLGKRPVLNDLISALVLIDASTIANRNIANTAGVAVTKDNTSYSTAVAMVGNAVGAFYAEDVDTIRKNASILYRTKNNAIKSSSDCKAILEEYADIRKAYAFNIFNTIYFAVIREDGVPADNTFMAELVARISPIVCEQYNVAGSLTSIVQINEVTVDAYHYNEFASADIIEQVKDFIEYISDPMGGAEYATPFDLGAVSQAAIRQISGLTNLVFKTIDGVTAANVPVGSLQILGKISREDITVNPVRVS